MFDIGFQELMLIAVVALLVIGPERMPGVARKAGMWFGKARRFVGSIKEDIDREFASDELKRIMQEQKDAVGIHQIIEETKDVIEDTKDVIDEAKQEYLLNSADDNVQETESTEPLLDNNKPDDDTGK